MKIQFEKLDRLLFAIGPLFVRGRIIDWKTRSETDFSKLIAARRLNGAAKSDQRVRWRKLVTTSRMEKGDEEGGVG